MHKAAFKFLLLTALAFAAVNGFAQEKKVANKVQIQKLHLDTGEVKVQPFNKAKLEEYSDQRAFKYDTIPQEMSLWARFWIWFWQKIGSLFNGAVKNPLSQYFFIALGVAVVAFIAYKMIGAEALFSKKSKEAFLPYDVMNENIHEIDYKAELARLVSEGKYRLAVRLLYLQSLKKLSDNHVIDWRPEKTNYNYLAEINQPELRAEFARLTHQFDYIWYGDFPVDKIKFEPINQTFSHFNAQIK